MLVGKGNSLSQFWVGWFEVDVSLKFDMVQISVMSNY
jgi:hypothetical protein